MTSLEIGLELNFDNIMSITFMLRSIPWPHSSHVASSSLVYNQAARARWWIGVIHWDKKMDITTSDVKPCLARN
jgi:hypothetical protein